MAEVAPPGWRPPPLRRIPHCALPERLAIFLPAATSPDVRARSEPATSTRLRRPAPSQCVFKAHRRGGRSPRALLQPIALSGTTVRLARHPLLRLRAIFNERGRALAVKSAASMLAAWEPVRKPSAARRRWTLEPLGNLGHGVGAGLCCMWRMWRMCSAEALALSLLMFARCRIWLLCDPMGAVALAAGAV
jgi:hypothetical protein